MSDKLRPDWQTRIARIISEDGMFYFDGRGSGHPDFMNLAKHILDVLPVLADSANPEDAPEGPNVQPVVMVQANADAHLHHWTGESDSYWLQRLMQGVGELASVLEGDHADTVEHELIQIGGIAVNWLRRDALNHEVRDKGKTDGL